VARGAIVTVDVTEMLARACSRSVSFEVSYNRLFGDVPRATRLGTTTVKLPAGTTVKPPPRRR
jgi:hypothetical protein